jgi:hypothetical protein
MTDRRETIVLISQIIDKLQSGIAAEHTRLFGKIDHKRPLDFQDMQEFFYSTMI